jgi:hypothetical protein
VPAVTFRPSDSIAIANCLASISVGNDFVSLARGTAEEKRRKPKCFGVSTETNQWLIDLYLAMMAAVAALGHARMSCANRSTMIQVNCAQNGAVGGGQLSRPSSTASQEKKAPPQVQACWSSQGLSGWASQTRRSPRRVNSYMDQSMEEKITHPRRWAHRRAAGKILVDPMGYEGTGKAHH